MNKVVEDWQTRISQTVARWIASLRRFDVFSILLDTLGAFNADNMSLLAASLSYYALLALFPLLLLLIVSASPFLAQGEVLTTVLGYVEQTLPGASEEIDRVLRQVLDARGSATIIGVLALFWSASGLFDVVQTALDRAWRVPKRRAFWKQRLFSLGMLALLGSLFVASLIVSTITDEVIRAALALTQDYLSWLGRLVSWIMAFFAFTILYQFFPHAHVSRRTAFIGAFVAAVLWEIAKNAYGLYLIHFARFNLVYGSVGAVIGLLLWGYISATILLFGAELSAVVGRRQSGAGRS
jgi:membrane protein